MFLALVEPHTFATEPKNVFLIIKEYSLNEFYNNEWVDEVKNKRNKLIELISLNSYIHPLLRNYFELIKKKYYHLQLVEKYKNEYDNKEYVILHTYKLNIFKRIWRKRQT